MQRQRNRHPVKRYILFFVLCAAILIVGAIFSIPIRLEVHTLGEKPPFLLALFMAIISLAMTIIGAYISYFYWSQETKARAHLKNSMAYLANRYLFFRLPIYHPGFLFWFIRFFMPIEALLMLGLFLLVIFGAF